MRIDERGGRLRQLGDEVVAEERGEEQRRGLARRAGHRQHDAGQDARQPGRQHHLPDHLGAGAAHAVGGVLHALRHLRHGLLGGEHHGRQHQHRQGDAAGPGRVAPVDDQDRVDEDAGQDRGEAGQDLGQEARGLGQPAVGDPGRQIDGREDTDRHADARGDATITSVPTMACPKPPPISKPAGGSAVRTSRSSVPNSGRRPRPSACR